MIEEGRDRHCSADACRIGLCVCSAAEWGATMAVDSSRAPRIVQRSSTPVIAALHAGLKLTPDQEKSWSGFEQAYRGLAASRAEAMNGFRNRDRDSDRARRSRSRGRSAPPIS